MAKYKDLSEFPADFDPDKYKQDAEKLGSEVANALNTGYVRSLRKSDIQVNRAFQTRYSALKYQLEFGLLSQEDYFKKLEAIRDMYYSKDTQEWYEYTAEIYSYKVGMLKDYEQAVEENLAELAKMEEQAAQEAADYLQSCVDDFSKNSLSKFSQIAAGAEKMLEQIENARGKYEDKLYDYAGTGTGFDTFKTKIHNYYPTGDPLVIVDYSLSDLDADINRLKEFNDAVTELKSRAGELGVDAFRSFFEELRTLDIEDAKILTDLMLEADDEAFSNYLETFQKKHRLAGDIADGFYQDDFAKAASGIKKAVEDEFSDIPADFFSYGELTAENFQAGFLSQIESMFDAVSGLLEQQGLEFAPSLNTNPENNTFAPTYNLYSYGETTAQQLISARNHAILEKLRQGAGGN